MTRNQISYFDIVERQRNNRATEQLRAQEAAEAARSNRARETETSRSNRANEAETSRWHNLTTAETNRSNLANEKLKAESNDITRGYNNAMISETILHNRNTEAEVAKHNRATEASDYARNSETAMHNRNTEALTAASNKNAADANSINALRNTAQAEYNRGYLEYLGQSNEIKKYETRLEQKRVNDNSRAVASSVALNDAQKQRTYSQIETDKTQRELNNANAYAARQKGIGQGASNTPDTISKWADALKDIGSVASAAAGFFF